VNKLEKNVLNLEKK